MKHGFVESVDTRDAGGYCVRVSVNFQINRSMFYEFMDCLIPVDEQERREPIAAILDHSRQEVDR